MTDDTNVDARIVCENGKLEVKCSRRSADGAWTCAGKFETLVVWPDGGRQVVLKPHGRWHHLDRFAGSRILQMCGQSRFVEQVASTVINVASWQSARYLPLTRQDRF